jgi:acetaldehyde dehydrogenase/alcohol dehydrogenase
MIVTDKSIERLGFVQRVIDQLNARSNQVTIQVFSDVEPDPDITTVERGAELMRAFQPDTIIALGGGSPMDLAKVMWLFYEQPEIDFRDLVQKSWISVNVPSNSHHWVKKLNTSVSQLHLEQVQK